MAREEFLDELSDDFPPQRIYSHDETVRYFTERRELMDAVLEGTFETYECAVKECGFRYKISADADFELEVSYKDETWRKTFPYIAEAFDIAEAAYRFFIVVPRVLDEAEALRSYIPSNPNKPAELIVPPHYRERGEYVFATIFRCTNGTYMLSIVHRRAAQQTELLDKYFTDADFAELIANKYLEIFDQKVIGPPDDIYNDVYAKVTH